MTKVSIKKNKIKKKINSINKSIKSHKTNKSINPTIKGGATIDHSDNDRARLTLIDYQTRNINELKIKKQNKELSIQLLEKFLDSIINQLKVEADKEKDIQDARSQNDQLKQMNDKEIEIISDYTKYTEKYKDQFDNKEKMIQLYLSQLFKNNNKTTLNITIPIPDIKTPISVKSPLPDQSTPTTTTTTTTTPRRDMAYKVGKALVKTALAAPITVPLAQRAAATTKPYTDAAYVRVFGTNKTDEEKEREKESTISSTLEITPVKLIAFISEWKKQAMNASINLESYGLDSKAYAYGIVGGASATSSATNDEPGFAMKPTQDLSSYEYNAFMEIYKKSMYKIENVDNDNPTSLRILTEKISNFSQINEYIIFYQKLNYYITKYNNHNDCLNILKDNYDTAFDVLVDLKLKKDVLMNLSKKAEEKEIECIKYCKDILITIEKIYDIHDKIKEIYDNLSGPIKSQDDFKLIMIKIYNMYDTTNIFLTKKNKEYATIITPGEFEYALKCVVQMKAAIELLKTKSKDETLANFNIDHRVIEQIIIGEDNDRNNTGSIGKSNNISRLEKGVITTKFDKYLEGTLVKNGKSTESIKNLNKSKSAAVRYLGKKIAPFQARGWGSSISGLRLNEKDLKESKIGFYKKYYHGSLFIKQIQSNRSFNEASQKAYAFISAAMEKCVYRQHIDNLYSILAYEFQLIRKKLITSFSGNDVTYKRVKTLEMDINHIPIATLSKWFIDGTEKQKFPENDSYTKFNRFFEEIKDYKKRTLISDAQNIINKKEKIDGYIVLFDTPTQGITESTYKTWIKECVIYLSLIQNSSSEYESVTEFKNKILARHPLLTSVYEEQQASIEDNKKIKTLARTLIQKYKDSYKETGDRKFTDFDDVIDAIGEYINSIIAESDDEIITIETEAIIKQMQNELDEISRAKFLYETHVPTNKQESVDTIIGQYIQFMSGKSEVIDSLIPYLADFVGFEVKMKSALSEVDKKILNPEYTTKQKTTLQSQKDLLLDNIRTIHEKIHNIRISPAYQQVFSKYILKKTTKIKEYNDQLRKFNQVKTSNDIKHIPLFMSLLNVLYEVSEILNDNKYLDILTEDEKQMKETLESTKIELNKELEKLRQLEYKKKVPQGQRQDQRQGQRQSQSHGAVEDNEDNEDEFYRKLDKPEQLLFDLKTISIDIPDHTNIKLLNRYTATLISMLKADDRFNRTTIQSSHLNKLDIILGYIASEYLTLINSDDNLDQVIDPKTKDIFKSLIQNYRKYNSNSTKLAEIIQMIYTHSE